MTKKEYVMKALYALKDHRNLAPGLIKMMQNNEIDDNGILGLYDILSKAIDEVADETLKKKLSASMQYIKKIQEMEKSFSSDEEKELENLENIIQSS